MDAIQNFWAEIWGMIDTFVLSMFQTWRIYQIAILLGIFVLSHFMALLIHPKLNTWMRSLSGKSPTQLRVIISIARRLRGLVFVLTVWSVYVVMQETTWPSRSYLIGLYASIATAWTLMAVAAPIVRNIVARKVLRFGIWAYVTAEILGATDNILVLMDAVAISIGDFRLSLLIIAKGVLSLLVVLTITRWLAALISRRLQPVEEISPSMKVLTDKITRLTLYTIAFIIILQSIGFDLTSITVLSGAIGLGLGFGLQKVVSNLVSGMILLLDKSIKPGDVISVGETFGWISSLGARYVSVVTREGKEHLIPNEDLITGQVVNWSHSSDLVRLDVPFGVAYGSNPHEVREIAMKAAASIKRVVNVPTPQCHMVGFGDSSLDFKLRFWIKDPSDGLTNVRGQTYLALWDAFQEHNIEIPFPRRDVTLLPTAEPAEIPDA